MSANGLTPRLAALLVAAALAGCSQTPPPDAEAEAGPPAGGPAAADRTDTPPSLPAGPAGPHRHVLAAGAIQPHAAVDGGGRVYVAFIRKGNIAVSASADGGRTFAEPVVAIDVSGQARGGRQRSPRVGVDAAGKVYVTAPVTFDPAQWQQKYPRADLYLVTSGDGGRTWTAPARVNERPGEAPEALHWLAVGPDGAEIAWLDRRDRAGRPGQDVYVARVTDGRVGENRPAARTVCECCAPGLAVDAGGNAYLAYREGGDKDSREIYIQTSADGGKSFSGRVQVNSKPTRIANCPMSAPALAAAPDGKLFAAAWSDERAGDGVTRVYWARSGEPDFPADTAIHPAAPGRQDHPSLAVDAGKTVWAAWEDSASGTQQVWLCSSAEPRPRQLSEDAEGECGYPAVAAGGGVVVVAYEATRGRQQSVVCRVLGR